MTAITFDVPNAATVRWIGLWREPGAYLSRILERGPRNRKERNAVKMYHRHHVRFAQPLAMARLD